MMLLMKFDAQLKALARLKELEMDRSAGYAQAKYGEVSGGGACADMLPSGLVYQVRVTGADDRPYVFTREELDAAWGLLARLANPKHREMLKLVYLTYGDLRDKARMVGAPWSTFKSRRDAAVIHFSRSWIEMMQGYKLPAGCGVLGRVSLQREFICANDA
ncbi:hypothetical protein [Deefgea piscis]|uniref:hypothetical protein n=1 Tax=Deefgea piscis TaxID=2739061 RepID=UPI001C7F6BC5|nr:hypothetical protein [Deefgea piscis]QZA80196.1 hypothetical protein K4H25_11700 [Deefgea piscis]